MFLLLCTVTENFVSNFSSFDGVLFLWRLIFDLWALTCFTPPFLWVLLFLQSLFFCFFFFSLQFLKYIHIHNNFVLFDVYAWRFWCLFWGATLCEQHLIAAKTLDEDGKEIEVFVNTCNSNLSQLYSKIIKFTPNFLLFFFFLTSKDFWGNSFTFAPDDDYILEGVDRCTLYDEMVPDSVSGELQIFCRKGKHIFKPQPT